MKRRAAPPVEPAPPNAVAAEESLHGSEGVEVSLHSAMSAERARQGAESAKGVLHGAPAVEAAEVLVIGAGAAGLTAALGCVPRRVVVLTKTRLSASGGGGASVWAQGGVASAVGEDDNPALHAADTLAAGAGLNDASIVRLLTGEGPQRIRALLEMGARFDRDAGGQLALGREAAHSRRRILHAHGDATGAEVVRTLVEAVHHEPAIQVVDRTFALDLLIEDGAVVGAAALRPDGRLVHYRAPAVVLATGGAGQLFLHTTNPREATADGLAMAARAGALLVDLEFVQFHPTALAPSPVPGPLAPKPVLGLDTSAGPAAFPGAPLPLLTEALRGEGAVLIDDEGTRFMNGEHPDRELAPRDVVARAIWKRLQAGRKVFLDARAAVGERFPQRFPTVFALCRQHGVDPRVEPMPVVPAAHYHMGGVAVDASGRTSLPGLWACGEVAATGAHGANRLASNSLLEALVFGARVAADLLAADRAAPARLVAGPTAASPQTVPAAIAAPRVSVADAALLSAAGVAAPRVSVADKVLRRASAAGVAAPEPPLAIAAVPGASVAAGWQPPAASPGAPSAMASELAAQQVGWEDPEARRRTPAAEALAGRLRRLMWERVGVERTGEGLAAATAELAAMVRRAEALAAEGGALTQAAGEVRNLAWTGGLVAQAALERRESRGGHFRSDHTCPDVTWQRRLFLTAAPDGTARWLDGPVADLLTEAPDESAAGETKTELPRAADRRS
jgi:L-aspartate oxidase